MVVSLSIKHVNINVLVGFSIIYDNINMVVSFSIIYDNINLLVSFSIIYVNINLLVSFSIIYVNINLLVSFPRFSSLVLYVSHGAPHQFVHGSKCKCEKYDEKKNINRSVNNYIIISDGQFWGSSLLALSVSNGTCHQFVYARLHTTLLHLRLEGYKNICRPAQDEEEAYSCDDIDVRNNS